jgi:PAS domain-containing protein
MELSQEILEKTPALISVYNIKTRTYIYVNDALLSILGYTKKVFFRKRGTRICNRTSASRGSSWYFSTEHAGAEKSE